MEKSFHILLLILLMLFVRPSLRAEGSARIFSYVSGNTGFVVVNQQIIIRLNSTYNGLTVTQRLKLIENRLAKIAATGGVKAELLQIREENGHIGLAYNGAWLILADPASAYHQRMTQSQLLEVWRNNLLDALPDISGRYQVVKTIFGVASWYGKEFRGRKTANGERFDERYYTAAHRNLKFGTKVRVTNLANGLLVIVTINDRGPWVKNRVIDLSWAAAKAIGLHGVGHVKVEILQPL